MALFGSARWRFPLVIALASLPALAGAQTLWTGPPITFSKPAFADPNLPQSQDRITPSTWITRAAAQGIYNIAQEAFFASGVSPANSRS